LTWRFTVERVTGIEPALSAWESVPSAPVTWPDLRGGVSASDRERPLIAGVNGPLMARMTPQARQATRAAFRKRLDLVICHGAGDSIQSLKSWRDMLLADGLRPASHARLWRYGATAVTSKRPRSQIRAWNEAMMIRVRRPVSEGIRFIGNAPDEHGPAWSTSTAQVSHLQRQRLHRCPTRSAARPAGTSCTPTCRELRSLGRSAE
jgi:hypothetical protein